MATLTSYRAHICQTAVGFLIHEGRTLLVKHRKLGIWLAPGGHLEPGEAPHQAAEREFWEETGVRVAACDPFVVSWTDMQSEYFPSPILTNLHWISEENYRARLESERPTEPYTSEQWPKGCEQHLGFIYLVRPTGNLSFKENKEETDGIAWFSEAELTQLETITDIRRELQYAFSLAE